MDLLELTKKIWTTYFSGAQENTVELLELLDPECTIIGTGKHELYHCAADYLPSLLVEVQERENIQFQFKDLWCRQKDLAPDIALVYGGVYVWWESKDHNIYINMDSRFSILYQKKNGRWRILHIHQSLPNMEQMDGEYYPKTLSKQVENSEKKIMALTALAQKDSLTQLINYRTFQDIYKQWDKENSWLLVLDLDNFKQINDTYGHLAGNYVLQKIAHVLSTTVRSHDIVCRMGGDEFVLLCSNLSYQKDVLELMQRLIEDIALEGTQEQAWVSVSVGGTPVNCKESLEDVFQRADRALYAAKSAGKNCCRLG